MQRVAEEIYKRINNEIYDLEGDRWWQPDCSLNLLKTLINPFRVGYAKKIIDRLKLNPYGKTALEVGCGGGLLCEEIARIGFSTYGIDPSHQSIMTASRHSNESGLNINYATGAGEALPYLDNTFDIAFCCDVLEHVQDLPGVISEISRVLKPGAVFIYDTINRTFLSNIITIKILQDWKRWAILPSRLHEWKMFIKPAEIKWLLSQNDFSWQEHRGIIPDVSVLKIWRYLHLRVKGDLTYEEFGKKFVMVESNFMNIMYMGFALKD